MNYRLNPCDLKYFDLHKCLHEHNFVEWKQHHYKYQVGDIVFIYTSAPESRISYMLVVVEVDIPLKDGFDDSEYVVDNARTKYQGYEEYSGNLVRFQFIRRIDSPTLDLGHLLKHGLKSAPQGPKYLDGDLLDYIFVNLD